MFGDAAGFTRVSLVADNIRCFPIGKADEGAADSVKSEASLISVDT
jgi:hypothetical protein